MDYPSHFFLYPKSFIDKTIWRQKTLNNNKFENAAQLYEKCELVSQLFVQLEKDGEIANIEKFREKKAESLNKINLKKNSDSIQK